MFTQPELLLVLRNTALWVILVPTLATGIGLIYAILIDRARGEAFAKALIFLPMAISMVGAGDHLEVRLPVQADLRAPDRPAERDPQAPRVRDRNSS